MIFALLPFIVLYFLFSTIICVPFAGFVADDFFANPNWLWVAALIMFLFGPIIFLVAMLWPGRDN